MEHAENLQAIMNAVGMSSRILVGRDSLADNAKTLMDFRAGEFSNLIGVDMLNEGIDVPDVDFIVFLRVTHSPTYFLQQLGRGLRRPKDNPEKELLVLDFVADLRRIGRVQALNDGYNSSKKIEDIELPENFNLEITNEYTKNFIDLVENEEGEIDELDETGMVYLKKDNN